MFQITINIFTFWIKFSLSFSRESKVVTSWTIYFLGRKILWDGDFEISIEETRRGTIKKRFDSVSSPYRDENLI